jgi:twitching motility protein PilT
MLGALARGRRSMADRNEVGSSLLEAVASSIGPHVSDIHLVPGYPISIRKSGELVAALPRGVDGKAIHAAAHVLIPERLRARFEAGQDCDFSATLGNSGKRVRVSLYRAQDQWCISMRVLPSDVPPFRWMGFPRGLAKELVNNRSGLVIIAGGVGQGKSTTLAALLSLFNRKGGYRVIALEEPVEYIQPRLSSTVVTQREVGTDVDSFLDALVSAVRQDPDVVLLGEIRDAATAQVALSAAEIGHLILTSIHARDAVGAISRLVDLFPDGSENEIRAQLAMSLRAVVCQHLLPPAKGRHRVLALEVLQNTDPVRSALRSGQMETLGSIMQLGSNQGHMPLDDHLRELVATGMITPETAMNYSTDKNFKPLGPTKPGIKKLLADDGGDEDTVRQKAPTS